MNDSGKFIFAAALENYKKQDYSAAEKLCRPLVDNPSATARTCFLWGLILGKTNRGGEAVHWLARAAELDPAAPEIWSELGRASNSLGDFARAANCFARFIELKPENADGYFCLGNAYQQLGRCEAAVPLYVQAIERNAQDAAAWNNLGKAFSELNRLSEAIAAYDRALVLKPESELTRRNRGIALLKSGFWAEGWRDYEWRRSVLVARPYPQPKWQGEVMPDKVLFVHAEQGFGDSLQFVRFIARARPRVGRVILECQPPLQRLFEQGAVADEIVPVGAAPSSFDVYVALASLPGIFGVRPEDLTGDAYLSAPAGDDFPAVPATQLKVGLVWAGNVAYGRDAERSIPFAQFQSLLQVEGMTFYNFQTTLPAADHVAHSALVSLTNQLGDFYATAAWLGKMDLIISVDTAVAHLAGALGKPVWTLLPFASDWRWLLGRSDTPWYRTMRLFRQDKSRDWSSVLAQVGAELSRLAGKS